MTFQTTELSRRVDNHAAASLNPTIVVTPDSLMPTTRRRIAGRTRATSHGVVAPSKWLRSAKTLSKSALRRGARSEIYSFSS